MNDIQISPAEVIDLLPNKTYSIIGLSSLYTYQTVGQASIVHGSNDKTNWVNIVELEANDSAVLQHSWQYLKVSSGLIVLRRG